MAEEVVVHVDKDFAVDLDVCVLPVAVRQVVEGEDDGPVGRVFKGYDADDGAAVLYLVKDVWCTLVGCARPLRREV